MYSLGMQHLDIAIKALETIREMAIDHGDGPIQAEAERALAQLATEDK